MEEKNETGPSVEPRPEQQCKQARPHDELIAELLDSRRAKTEREHAAAREIERLRKRCSPSRVVMIGDVGHYVSEGVAEGIESLRQAVKPFAEFDLLEHRIPPEFAMLVLRARGALERVVVTPNAGVTGAEPQAERPR